MIRFINIDCVLSALLCWKQYACDWTKRRRTAVDCSVCYSCHHDIKSLLSGQSDVKSLSTGSKTEQQPEFKGITRTSTAR